MQTSPVQTPALALSPGPSTGPWIADALASDPVLLITAANGAVVQIPMDEAKASGLVRVQGQRVGLTLAGSAEVARRAAAKDSVQSHSDAAAGASAVTAGKTADKPVSARMGEVASAMFLARGALNIAKGPGVPSFPTAWFFLTGLNKYAGKKLLPEWLQKGPVRTAIDFYIPATMIGPSLRGLKPAAATYRQALEVSKAAGKGGVGAHVRAAFSPINDAAAAGAAAAAAVKPSTPLLNLGPGNKIYGLIKPLTYLGFTISSTASILGLPEHLKEKGAGGLINTTSGRGALLGAMSGSAMLASLWLKASPVQAVADAASTVLWIAELVNGEGWLDGLFGGDPKKNTSGKRAGEPEENVPGRVNGTRASRASAAR